MASGRVPKTVRIFWRVLMLAADVGCLYRNAPYQNLPGGDRTPDGVTYQPEQTNWRVGLNWFFWRRTGIATLVYGETYREFDPGNPLRFPTERLIQLEAQLIDYVVVHELAHLREMNHSPAFWRLVQGVLPDQLERRRALARVRIEPD